MKLITAVDDNYGMLFNNRRISKDSVVLQKISELTRPNRLLINSFSASLFNIEFNTEFNIEANNVNAAVNNFAKNNIIIDDNMLSNAGDNDFCFVENCSALGYADKIDTLYIFKWNRRYPSDYKFDINPEKLFQLKSSLEFKGSSHDKITLEEWRRGDKIK